MRPTSDDTWMEVAAVVARRGTCPRRQVGAVIVDCDGHILSTGHNGAARNMPHCIDTPCPGVNDKAGDTSRCEAIHAEMNAIAWCHDRRHMFTLYTTTSPCTVCCKLILSTPIRRVIVRDVYPDQDGLKMLARAGVQVFHYRPNGTLTYQLFTELDPE